MAKSATTYWLNMTTLTDPEKVGGALDALQVAGVPTAFVGVAGQAGVLEDIGRKLLRGESQRAAFAPLFEELEPVFAVPPGTPILATRNSFLATVKSGLAPGSSGEEAGRCWLDPLSRSRLVSPLMNGAMLLVVNPRTHQQWMDGTRVLLKHSQSSVLSQEILR